MKRSRVEIWEGFCGEIINVEVCKDALKKHIEGRHPEAFLFWETLKANFKNPDAVFKDRDGYKCVFVLTEREYKYLVWVVKKSWKKILKKAFYLATFYVTDKCPRGNLIYKTPRWENGEDKFQQRT